MPGHPKASSTDMDDQSKGCKENQSRLHRNHAAVLKLFETRGCVRKNKIGTGQNEMTLLQPPPRCLTPNRTGFNDSSLTKIQCPSALGNSAQLDSRVRATQQGFSSPCTDDGMPQIIQAVGTRIDPAITTSAGLWVEKRDDPDLLLAENSNHFGDGHSNEAIKSNTSLIEATSYRHISLPVVNSHDCIESLWNASSRLSRKFTQIPADQLALLGRDDSWICGQGDVNRVLLPGPALDDLRENHARKESRGPVEAHWERSITPCIVRDDHRDIREIDYKPHSVSVKCPEDDLHAFQVESSDTKAGGTSCKAGEELAVCARVSDGSHVSKSQHDDDTAVACVEAELSSSPLPSSLRQSASGQRARGAPSPSFDSDLEKIESWEFRSTTERNKSTDTGQATVISVYDCDLFEHSMKGTENYKSMSSSLNSCVDDADDGIATLNSHLSDDDHSPEDGLTQATQDATTDASEPAHECLPMLQVQRTPIHQEDVTDEHDVEGIVANDYPGYLLPADTVPATFPENCDTDVRARSSTTSTYNCSWKDNTTVATSKPQAEPLDLLRLQHQQSQISGKIGEAENIVSKASCIRRSRMESQSLLTPAAAVEHTPLPLSTDFREVRHPDLFQDHWPTSDPKLSSRLSKRSRKSPRKCDSVNKRIRIGLSTMDNLQSCGLSLAPAESTKTLVKDREITTGDRRRLFRETLNLQAASAGLVGQTSETTICSIASSSESQSSLPACQTTTTSPSSDLMLPDKVSRKVFDEMQATATTSNVMTKHKEVVTPVESSSLMPASKALLDPSRSPSGTGGLSTTKACLGRRNLYQYFRDSYPSYAASLEIFVRACVQIDWLEKNAPHPSLWDDFVRACSSEYPDYVQGCREIHTTPLACIDFYNLHIPTPRFRAHLLSRSTLATALLIDMNLTARARQSLVMQDSATGGVFGCQRTEEVYSSATLPTSTSEYMSRKPTSSTGQKQASTADGCVKGRKKPAAPRPSCVSHTQPSDNPTVHTISVTATPPLWTVGRRATKDRPGIGSGSEVLRIIRSESNPDLKSIQSSFQAFAKTFKSERSIDTKEPSLQKP